MKDLLELMKTRRSVRKYKPDMIPQDVLDRITSRNLFRHRKKLAVAYYHCCHQQGNA